MFYMMVPIVQFDVLEQFNFLETYYTEKGQVQEFESIPYLDRLFELGYDSWNPITNLGSIIMFCMFAFLKMAAVIIMYPFKFYSQRLDALYGYLFPQAFFSDLIIIFVQGYFEFLIAGYVVFIVP